MKDTYVQAIQKAIHDGLSPDILLANVRAVMQKRGHERLLPTVLATVLRELLATRSTRTVVRVPDQAAYEAYKDAITAALEEHKSIDSPAIVCDGTLIGGYQVEANYHRIDASHKHVLASLYRNITTQ